MMSESVRRAAGLLPSGNGNEGLDDISRRYGAWTRQRVLCVQDLPDSTMSVLGVTEISTVYNGVAECLAPRWCAWTFPQVCKLEHLVEYLPRRRTRMISGATPTALNPEQDTC